MSERKPRDSHPAAALTAQEVRELLLRVDSGLPPESQRTYARREAQRVRRTLLRIPPAEEGWRLLDVGCWGPWVAAYAEVLGYRDIAACTAQPGTGLPRELRGLEGVEGLRFRADFLDVEVEPFPYADAAFDVVVSCSLLEHLVRDPMHMMSEIHRVLRPGGFLILTTPNAASVHALWKLLWGRSPCFSTLYHPTGVHRHNHEFTPGEVLRLVENSGFEVDSLETFGPLPPGVARLATALLALPAAMARRCPLRWRGRTIVVRARRAGPVQERWPAWLYLDPTFNPGLHRARGEIGRRFVEEWAGGGRAGP
ncbi:MAG: class I SAM-dependent methyltransferase [Candidatus Brocadiia bacterium]